MMKNFPTEIPNSNAATLSHGATPTVTKVALDTTEIPLSAMRGSSIRTDHAILTKGSATRFRSLVMTIWLSRAITHPRVSMCSMNL